MSDAENVTTVVIEIEPGWVYVKIAEPKPAPDRIEFLLRRTIQLWFGARPNAVIDRTEPVTDQGEMVGIHVRYHDTASQTFPTKSATELPNTFTIEVHGEIAQKHSKEYFEAVLDDAMKILPSYRDRQDTLVVINPRRVSVILDHNARKGAILPVEFIEQVVEGQMKERLQAYLANPPAPFYVMHISGGWFSQS